MCTLILILMGALSVAGAVCVNMFMHHLTMIVAISEYSDGIVDDINHTLNHLTVVSILVSATISTIPVLYVKLPTIEGFWMWFIVLMGMVSIGVTVGGFFHNQLVKQFITTTWSKCEV